MKKNKNLYKLVAVLFVILCGCFMISFTLEKNNQKIKNNTKVIDIKCKGEDCETNTIPKDTDDKKNDTNDSNIDDNKSKSNDSSNSSTSNNNDAGNNNVSNNTSSNESTTGTPVINDNGNTTVQDDNGNIEKPKSKISITDTYQTWKSTTPIRIFNVDKIAPGDSGSYNFVVNNNTTENVDYGIMFEEDNIASANILYKLKRNNEYIAGDDDTWVKYNELDFDNKILNENEIDKYNIEWKWVDSESDTAAGRMLGAKYKLNVVVKGAQTEEFDKYSKATLNPLTGDKILHYIELALLSWIVLILLAIKRRQKA